MSLPFFFFFRRRLSLDFNPYTNPWLHNLTPKGRAQAKGAARELEKIVELPVVVVSSDAPRALQTARYISSNMGCKRYYCPDLCEREMNYHSGYFIETTKRAAERFGKKLEHLVRVYSSVRSLIVVSHLHAMMGYLSGVDEHGEAKDLNLKNGELICGTFMKGKFNETKRILPSPRYFF